MVLNFERLIQHTMNIYEIAIYLLCVNFDQANCPGVSQGKGSYAWMQKIIIRHYWHERTKRHWNVFHEIQTNTFQLTLNFRTEMKSCEVCAKHRKYSNLGEVWWNFHLVFCPTTLAGNVISIESYGTLKYPFSCISTIRRRSFSCCVTSYRAFNSQKNKNSFCLFMEAQKVGTDIGYY